MSGAAGVLKNSAQYSVPRKSKSEAAISRFPCLRASACPRNPVAELYRLGSRPCGWCLISTYLYLVAAVKKQPLELVVSDKKPPQYLVVEKV